MSRILSFVRFVLLVVLLGGLIYGYATGSLSGWLDRLDTLVDNAAAPRTYREIVLRDLRRAGAISRGEEQAFQSNFTAADTQALTVPLPHREMLLLDSLAERSAQSIRFVVPAARIATVEVKGRPDRLFGELYRLNRKGEAAGRPLATLTPETPTLRYEALNRDEHLTLLLQSVPGTRVRAEVAIRTEAALLFPVAGKDRRAVKSFWGDSRDGGRRKHKGNDIFAPKGTPLLAVTDGRIRKVANGGLGGKTVWLRDDKRGQSYYYAHLDEQFVRAGQRVRRGDTLGTVGNTGNARTTPPHLHFGVYARGAYDPFPLLGPDDGTPPAPTYRLGSPGDTIEVPRRGNHYLRLTPERKGEVIRQLQNGEVVAELGATGRFYRVRTAEGEYGYVNFD